MKALISVLGSKNLLLSDKIIIQDDTKTWPINPNSMHSALNVISNFL